MPMLLAGDLGGTNTRLAIVSPEVYRELEL
jgi:glucokinase